MLIALTREGKGREDSSTVKDWNNNVAPLVYRRGEWLWGMWVGILSNLLCSSTLKQGKCRTNIYKISYGDKLYVLDVTNTGSVGTAHPMPPEN